MNVFRDGKPNDSNFLCLYWLKIDSDKEHRKFIPVRAPMSHSHGKCYHSRSLLANRHLISSSKVAVNPLTNMNIIGLIFCFKDLMMNGYDGQSYTEILRWSFEMHRVGNYKPVHWSIQQGSYVKLPKIKPSVPEMFFYCPARVIRPFKKGRETFVCTLIGLWTSTGQPQMCHFSSTAWRIKAPVNWFRSNQDDELSSIRNINMRRNMR